MKPKQYLHLNIVSSIAYTLVFEVISLYIYLNVVCTHADANELHFKPVKISHTHHSRPKAAAALFELRVYRCDDNILAPLECQSYWTIKTGMTENRLSRLSLR